MWIGLFLSISLVSLVLFLLEWYQLDKRENDAEVNKSIKKENKVKPETTFAAVIDFVLGTLLYQGKSILLIYFISINLKFIINCNAMDIGGSHYYCDGHKGLITRWVLASWCLASLILSTAYSSVLISFVTSPFSIPFIDSIYNLEKYPGIILKTDVAYDLVVDKSVISINILNIFDTLFRH